MRLGARAVAACAVVGTLAVGLGACGESASENVVATPPPPAKPEDFPSAKGKTLQKLLSEVGESGPVLVAAVSQFEPGENRFGFALFDLARAQIADAPVALYVAPAGGGPVQGPILADYEEMAVDPQFQSRSVSSDPDAAKSVYVAQLDLPKPGAYEVIGVTRLDDRLVAATPAGGPLTVRRDTAVPEVGESAPVVNTRTEADVHGNLQEIDTRVPPSTMHDVDFADVVGREPTVLLFATAALCQSRVCGPVIDVAEQVKSERGDEATFVHSEIYRDNDIEKGFLPEVAAWNLPTEPWVFTIDSSGNVAARIEGAFSPAELHEAIDAAVGG